MANKRGLKAIPGETRKQREIRVMGLRFQRQFERDRVAIAERFHRAPEEICGGKTVLNPDAVRPIVAPCVADMTNISAAWASVGPFV